jgi:hypothetical protein
LDNLQSNSKGLEYSSLPQSIQDGITTTRRLGVEYLWVDALCIIQDNPDDKDREIRKMGDYYKSSVVTIAAATASTVTGGFLHPRTPPPACELPLYLPNEPPGKICAVIKIFNDRPKEPLHTRAWALQEFLLSPRLLIFGTREAVWQCQSVIAPVLPSHVSYNHRWPCDRLPTIPNIPGQQVTATILDEREVGRRFFIWQSIVKDYTSRKLTLSEDRLPAIEGIARELEKAWNDTYIAGMWRNQLLWWLLWKSDSNVRIADRLKTPSWSWAAVEGKITYHWFGQVVDSAEIRGYEDGQLYLYAVVKPLSELFAGMLKSALPAVTGLYPEAKIDLGIEDGGTLHFVLLGFRDHEELQFRSACGLVVKRLDGQRYTRVNMIRDGLPTEPEWWSDSKEIITLI